MELGEVDSTINVYSITIKSICFSLLAYFGLYELRSALKQGKNYLTEIWNFIDFFLILLYIIISGIFLFSDSM